MSSGGMCSSVFVDVTSPTTASITNFVAQAVGATVQLSWASPDGTSQVTYNQMPLYTFAQDRRAGEIRGQRMRGEERRGPGALQRHRAHRIPRRPADERVRARRRHDLSEGCHHAAAP